MVLLELLLNLTCGVISGLITYHMINYQAYVQADNPLESLLGYIAVTAMTSLTASVR